MIENELLEVSGLEVIYEVGKAKVRAINKIDFSLSKGETLGIVGESGAGKSAVALAIMRLLPEANARILAGSILFNGKDLLQLSMPEMRKTRGEKIAMIFQDPMTALNPVMPVGDQIYEILRYHNVSGMPKWQLEARVDEVLELVGIPAFRKKEYPFQFSGGMRQRVVIAVAVACQPELLIADEPTTSLDVTIQAQVLAMIRQLRDKLDTSMILITHNLGIVAQMCDKVAIMYSGEIVEYGPIEKVFEGDIHHPYTIGLFNSLPKLNDNADRLTPIDGFMPDPTELPAGCKFSARCTRSSDVCVRTPPKPDAFSSDGHRIACHLYAQEFRTVSETPGVLSGPPLKGGA